ncbi:TRAP transporter substrate-binding protein [Gelidibacter maritimus]|uniref:TRAP transporter substrate-binding protein n=1 Tax=Gelidibacter maritimus TaxID=2761487 RepID=A0A7W2M2I9_9FLAO|nr:TRAP transporter substrate-binding protein [Gelidibacter maritimus]MBA6151549.1 TRAP transporter substrate-binding protein [Gelidibacter maritimus]
MKKYKYKYMLFAIVLFLGLVSCESIKKTKAIKLAHGLDETHPVHKAMVFMGQELEKKSDGTLNIHVYPNQQLGSERQCLELLQIGSLGMTKVSAAVMENFSPNMKVFGLPYLFENREQAFRVLDGPIGKELLDGGTKYWLKGLGYYDAGSRSFYTVKEPIEEPDDLKGLKIRVMESVTAMNMIKSMGGAPTPISSGELYTALQQGVVDGAENNPPTFYLTREYEVCKYFSLDEHTTIPDVLIMSTHLWDSLNEEEQGWVQEAADASVQYQRTLWAKAEDEAIAAVEKAGVTVSRPDKAPFMEKVTSVYESYKDNPEVYSLIQRIQETD